MKSRSNLFLLSILTITTIIACNNSESGKESAAATTKDPVKSPELVFDKIVGTWQNEDGKNFERWNKNTDGTYESRVFSLKGSDTMWKETAKIFPENNSWVFENVVQGQNEGKATRFTSTILNEKSVQFSNPAHDFPTDINYTVADAFTINAFIIGPNSKGGKDTIPFNYKKVE